MSLEPEAPGVAGWESVLATGEREAGSWRGNPGCSELVIRSTMLDKQSKLDKELLSVAYTKDTRRKPLKKKKSLLMLPLKLQVSSFETQRSGSHRKPGRNLQQISSNSWGWSWGVEKHLGNISSKSSLLCVYAWMYLLGGFWAEDVCLFCPAQTPINTILFSSQYCMEEQTLLW